MGRGSWSRFVQLQERRSLCPGERDEQSAAQPCGRRKANDLPQGDGDEKGFIFRALLRAIADGGFLETIRNAEQPVPNCSWSEKGVKKFHGCHWKDFVRGCRRPWEEMTLKEKQGRLGEWMFQKFSLDPDKKVLLPRHPKPRAPRN